MLSLLLGRSRLKLRSRRSLPGVSCCWEELANARRALTDSFAENVAKSGSTAVWLSTTGVRFLPVLIWLGPVTGGVG